MEAAYPHEMPLIHSIVVIALVKCPFLFCYIHYNVQYLRALYGCLGCLAFYDKEAWKNIFPWRGERSNIKPFTYCSYSTSLCSASSSCPSVFHSCMSHVLHESGCESAQRFVDYQSTSPNLSRSKQAPLIHLQWVIAYCMHIIHG